jgi:hypothetical protein
MASAFPLEVVTAPRWVEDPAHKSLTGDALMKALEVEPWDPSVKSAVPFPVVLGTLNNNLPWLQQLGYAFATQQADVFDSIQRLRQRAQASGHLQSSPQQVVSTQNVIVEPGRPGAPAGGGQAGTQKEVIVIEPAQADTVYVPSYDPGTVYGDWPYPSYPPYYAASPTGYYFGTALATGLAFAAGVAVVGGLWGWARPAWGGAYANVNVNRWNNINVVSALRAGRPSARRWRPAFRERPAPRRCLWRYGEWTPSWTVRAARRAEPSAAVEAAAVLAADVDHRCGVAWHQIRLRTLASSGRSLLAVLQTPAWPTHQSATWQKPRR